ncbi:MAG: hypothetical protein K0U23_06925 [Gammaproteobacteria bacterium]|nr:hypothetical protein [Gammaproteobacteria bacterium]
MPAAAPAADEQAKQPNEKVTVVIFGLDNSGKTNLIRKIKREAFLEARRKQAEDPRQKEECHGTLRFSTDKNTTDLELWETSRPPIFGQRATPKCFTPATLFFLTIDYTDIVNDFFIADASICLNELLAHVRSQEVTYQRELKIVITKCDAMPSPGEKALAEQKINRWLGQMYDNRSPTISIDFISAKNCSETDIDRIFIDPALAHAERTATRRQRPADPDITLEQQFDDITSGDDALNYFRALMNATEDQIQGDPLVKPGCDLMRTKKKIAIRQLRLLIDNTFNQTIEIENIFDHAKGPRESQNYQHLYLIYQELQKPRNKEDSVFADICHGRSWPHKGIGRTHTYEVMSDMLAVAIVTLEKKAGIRGERAFSEKVIKKRHARWDMGLFSTPAQSAAKRTMYEAPDDAEEDDMPNGDDHGAPGRTGSRESRVSIL